MGMQVQCLCYRRLQKRSRGKLLCLLKTSIDRQGPVLQHLLLQLVGRVPEVTKGLLLSIFHKFVQDLGHNEHSGVMAALATTTARCAVMPSAGCDDRLRLASSALELLKEVNLKLITDGSSAAPALQIVEQSGDLTPAQLDSLLKMWSTSLAPTGDKCARLCVFNLQACCAALPRCL